jgi:hypothetical protein
MTTVFVMALVQPSRRSHMLAAVDGKLGAVDVARLLGAQEAESD